MLAKFKVLGVHKILELYLKWIIRRKRPVTLQKLEACNFIGNDLLLRYELATLLEVEFNDFTKVDIFHKCFLRI